MLGRFGNQRTRSDTADAPTRQSFLAAAFAEKPSPELLHSLVEVVVTFFSMCPEAPRLCSSRGIWDHKIFPEEARKQLSERLGPLRTFDVLRLDEDTTNVDGNLYTFNLGIYEQRQHARMIIDLSNTEADGYLDDVQHAEDMSALTFRTMLERNRLRAKRHSSLSDLSNEPEASPRADEAFTVPKTWAGEDMPHRGYLRFRYETRVDPHGGKTNGVDVDERARVAKEFMGYSDKMVQMLKELHKTFPPKEKGRRESKDTSVSSDG